MFTIPNNATVYLSLSSVDFRKQIRGLKKWVRNEMKMDPLSETYFLFISKNKKSMKILYYDGQGSCLHTKQLSQGKFKWWDSIHDTALNYLEIKAIISQVILMNGSVKQLQIQENWKRIG